MGLSVSQYSNYSPTTELAWDEPAYPEAIYLVVSVYGDDARGYKAFAWDAAQTDFVEVEIAVQD